MHCVLNAKKLEGDSFIDIKAFGGVLLLMYDKNYCAS